MIRALSLVALAALTACGGGGSGGGFAPPADTPAPAPTQTALKPAAAPATVNPGCVTGPDGLFVTCDLIASDVPLGVTIPARGFVSFTNRTGSALQVNQINAYTGETAYWSEFCSTLDVGSNNQKTPGIGEVACITKQPNQNYLPLTFGSGTGMTVQPGQVITMGSHTEPAMESHTFTLNVAPQATGVQMWRQPRADDIVHCNGLPQATAWAPWTNTTGVQLHVHGALIYAESGTATASEMNGSACVYVLNADGTVKTGLCNDALRTRGDASFEMTVEPGEALAAQAINTCAAPGLWDYAAYLRVW